MKYLLLLVLVFPATFVPQTSSTSDTPSDIEVLKFSWAESPSRKPAASAAAASNGVDASVSGSEKRVAEENSARPSLDQGSGRTLTRSSDFKLFEYTFSVSIMNGGSKTIQRIQWAYFLRLKEPNAQTVAWLFQSKAKIEPGKKKSLQDSSVLMEELSRKVRVPTNATRSSFSDKVVIIHIDYSDGSAWQNPTKYQDVQLLSLRKKR